MNQIWTNLSKVSGSKCKILRVRTYENNFFWQEDLILIHIICLKKITVLSSNSVTSLNFFSGDHTECIEIDFDPTKISYTQILTIFWNNHEYGLTTRIKTQYQSLILYHNDKQKEMAEQSKEKEQLKRAPEQIITRVEKAGTFFPAEE